MKHVACPTSPQERCEYYTRPVPSTNALSSSSLRLHVYLTCIRSIRRPSLTTLFQVSSHRIASHRFASATIYGKCIKLLLLIVWVYVKQCISSLVIGTSFTHHWSLVVTMTSYSGRLDLGATFMRDLEDLQWPEYPRITSVEAMRHHAVSAYSGVFA